MLWKACRLYFFLESTSLLRTEKDRWNPTLTTQTNLATKLTPTEQKMELNSDWWDVVVYMDSDWRNVVVTTVRRRRGKLWSELETLRELDAKISNLTQQCNRKFNKATTEKKTGQRLGLFLGRDDLTLIFFVGFFVDSRYEEQNQSRQRKLVNLTEQPGNLIPLDRGEGVPIFRWDGGDRLWWRRLSRPDYKRAKTLRLSDR